MANIKVIAEHSVDLDLLSGGICIDAGCRGFQFSEAMRDLGCEVWAFDIEDMEAPEGIKFFKQAIMHYNGTTRFVNTKDVQAKYISESGTVDVQCKSINQIYDDVTPGIVDILKLDIEASEYFILSDRNFRPIPKQLSIEFHLHCQRDLHHLFYDKCMENLLKWYEPVQHELSAQHGAGMNYWESLFVRRDLIQK